MKAQKLASLSDRLASAARAFVENDIGEPLSIMAEQFIAEEAELVEAFTHQWQIAAIVAALRSARSAQAMANRIQSWLFPEFEEQFDLIPIQIPLGSKRVRRDAFTCEAAHDYVESLLIIRMRRRPPEHERKIEQARKMASLFDKYDPERPGITWAEIVGLEGAAGAEAGAKKVNK